MKYFYLIILFGISMLSGNSQNFDKFFINQTLRLDFIFSGDIKAHGVSLHEMSKLPQWNGRVTNLDKLLLDGNGQITVFDIASDDCIYKNSFSTLFQEWLTTDEAQNSKRAFENTFLMPYPQNRVRVEVRLRDKNGVYNLAFKQIIDPKDILIKPKGFGSVTPYTYLLQADSTVNCINVVILAEGYRPSEMAKFRKQATVACEQIMKHEPFGKYKDRFNFIAVETASKESGVSTPRANRWKNTVFGSHFDTFYQDRYLTTTNVFDIHDTLAGIKYDHIIILANTDEYGGGGIFNAYSLTTAGHEEFRLVVVHEFGHSFGGLADEYFYDKDLFSDTYSFLIEPWEMNITTLKNFGTKWKNMLNAGTPIPTPTMDAGKYPVGVYEGAAYSAKGMYRGSVDCRMRTNVCESFCPVCQRNLEELIKFYTEEGSGLKRDSMPK